MGEMSSRGLFQTLVHGWVLLTALPWAQSQSQQFPASFWAASCPSCPTGSRLPLSTCCLSKEWGSKSEIFLFVYVATSSESLPKKCPWLLTMPPWRCFCLLEIGWKPCPPPGATVLTQPLWAETGRVIQTQACGWHFYIIQLQRNAEVWRQEFGSDCGEQVKWRLISEIDIFQFREFLNYKNEDLEYGKESSFMTFVLKKRSHY